jgi:hypothetical protein
MTTMFGVVVCDAAGAGRRRRRRAERAAIANRLSIVPYP